MAPKDRASFLLEEWQLCKHAKPRNHVVNIQLDKDECERWASHVQWNALWSDSDIEIAEACNQFEVRLKQYKDKIIIEILQNGAV